MLFKTFLYETNNLSRELGSKLFFCFTVPIIFVSFTDIVLDGENNSIDEVEDSELDMEDLDSSLDMVTRLFRMSITSGILCQPVAPTKVK